VARFLRDTVRTTPPFCTSRRSAWLLPETSPPTTSALSLSLSLSLYLAESDRQKRKERISAA